MNRAAISSRKRPAHWRAIGLLIVGASGLTACAPPPTPLPAGLLVVNVTPTPAPTLEAAALPVYAVDVRLHGLIDLSTASTGTTVQIADTAPPAAALWLTLDDVPGAVVTPLTAVTIVTWDAAQPPLTDPALLTALELALAPTADAATIRAQLANTGYPDGIDLPVSAAAWLLPVLTARLTPAGLFPHPADSAAVRVTLTLAPPSDAVILAQFPVRYAAAPGTLVTLTADGLPRLEASE